MAGFEGIKDYEDVVKLKKDILFRKIIRESFRTLIKLSPVDTGNFRGSWLGSLDVPVAGARDDSVTQSIGSFSLVKKGMEPNAFEESNLNGIGMNAKVGQVAYITNNVSYAGSLENGHSPQASGGILHPAAQKMRARYKSLK